MAGILNLYSLLVVHLFGSFLVALIGLSILLIVLGMFTRQSPFLIMCILFSFILAYGIGYIGIIVPILAFVFAFSFFVNAMYNWINGK